VTLPVGIDTAALSVLLDLRHPLAYLALQPTIALAQTLALDVNWLPLEVPTLRPPSQPRQDDDRGMRHRRYRAQAIAREIETYAGAQGLVLRDAYRDGSAQLAKLGWLWLRDRHPDRIEPYLAGIFRSYWALALDPADPEQIAAQIDSAGGDAAAFLAWAEHEGPQAAAALAAELRERGLFQVPAFVLGDEVFYGRQHLPMIRWILEGRSGPIPI
jgi:2-hydroxychromene-2-carboxylate isomerase